MRPHPGWALVLVLMVAVSWPLALSPTTTLIGDPALETVDHLWALWLGTQHGLVAHTTAVGWPEPYTWVIADPLHIPVYGLGAAISPALGFNLVQLFDLALAAVGAAALARTTDLAPGWLAASFAVLVPPLAAGLGTGMSDAQGFGLTLLALAALHHAGRRQRPGWTATAALALGATAWAGPYVALYTALLAPIFVRWSRGGIWHSAVAGLGSLALASPVFWAIGQRPGGLPGSYSLLEQLIARPDSPKSLLLGADPRALLWPIDQGYECVYLGLALVFTALAAGRSRLWLGVAWALLLSLGAYLQWEGPVRLGERVVLAPAGWLMWVVEPLGRASRWYRMAVVAALLLAPLAAAGARRLGRWQWVPLLLVLTEALWLAPLPWPRDTITAPRPDFSGVEGPILHLPPPRAGGTDLRNRELLWQTEHGLPMGSNSHQAGPPTLATTLADEIMQDARKGDQVHTRALHEMGFQTLVHVRRDPLEEEWLRDALGPPDLDRDLLMAWRLPRE